MQWPLQLHWRKGTDIPTDGLLFNSSVIIDGMVYCGGNDHFNGVVQYNPENGDWSKLPEAPATGFTLTSLNGQLILVSGIVNDDQVRVWDSSSNQWVQPYPPIPTGRAFSAAVGYQNYLIVACGAPYMNKVDVLDSNSNRWYSVQPVPVGGQLMSSAVIGDYWYVSSFGQWKDQKKHIFWAHLPTLTSNITSTDARSTSTLSIWHELPTPPLERPTLLSLCGHLLLVGDLAHTWELYHYDQETRQWKECGQLPIGLYAPCCVVLPSGDLMVAGGWIGGSGAISKSMWIGTITH